MKRKTNGQTSAPTLANKPRLQIPVTEQQRTILHDAAESAASDLNMWALAHLMRAAKHMDASSVPIVISGDVADRVRKLAREQGITPDRIIQQLLLATGVA